MKKQSDIQQALLNIFKVGIKDVPLEELVKTCHLELIKLIGEDKAKNFYVAIYVGGYDYIFPYFRDEKDTDDPVNKPFNLKGGLTDYIRRHGKTECIDAAIEEELVKNGEIEGHVGADSHQWLGAPLKSAGKVYGVLVVQTYEPNTQYTEKDVKLVDYVSQNIALAVERKNKDLQLEQYKENLESKVRDKSAELLAKNRELKTEIAKVKKSEQIQKALYNISEAKSRTGNLHDLLAEIHRQVGTLMPAGNFYVAITEDEADGLYTLPYLVDENPGDRYEPDHVLDLSEGFTHYVVKTGKALLLNRGQIMEMAKKKEIGLVGSVAQSWVGAPLKTDTLDIFGVVAVQSYSDPNAYTEVDKKVLSIISSTIADAVYYKQLEAEKTFLEDKLLESQKMEAVGILAAGVAHEFNNLLSIIIGHAYNGMKVSRDQEAHRKRYRKIEEISERASDLVDKLMIFAQKRDRGEFSISNFEKAVRGTVLKVKDKAPKGCTLSIDITPPLWDITLDREDFHNILSNILDNAFLAVAEKEDGHVDISAENFEGRPRCSQFKKNCRYIQLTVQDNGAGMDEETREQMFNPFFTTRDPGQGTGLGLAIVYTLVNEYYGCIQVDSKQDKGTTVTVYLPIDFCH